MTQKSRPYKRSAEKVHDSHGRVHDETTNSPSPMCEGSAEPAKYQPRGFMVPRRGVHDCRTVAVIAGPVQIGPNAARSSVRSPAPSMRRTSGEPPAAERRPERGCSSGSRSARPSLPGGEGIRLPHSVNEPSISLVPVIFIGPRSMGFSRRTPIEQGKKDGEPVGLAPSPASATIMKVIERHEVESSRSVVPTFRLVRFSGPLPE
jgi:hypothetical protein